MYQNDRNEKKENRKGFRERLRRLSAMLMAAVMLASSAPLSALAEGEGQQLICGLAEHTHGPECYRSELTCGKDESAPTVITERTFTQVFQKHYHKDTCYNANSELICGYIAGEYYHIHNQYCKDENGTNVCGLEYSPVHEHTDACYTETKALICELPEEAGHTHSEECYDEEGNPICGLEEKEGHTHGEECYSISRELTCKYAKEHVHSSSCFETKYVNGEEVKYATCGHVMVPRFESTADSWTEKEVVADEGHQHTDACYTKELICTIQEHTHDASCYSTPDLVEEVKEEPKEETKEEIKEEVNKEEENKEQENKEEENKEQENKEEENKEQENKEEENKEQENKEEENKEEENKEEENKEEENKEEENKEEENKEEENKEEENKEQENKEEENKEQENKEEENKEEENKEQENKEEENKEQENKEEENKEEENKEQENKEEENKEENAKKSVSTPAEYQFATENETVMLTAVFAALNIEAKEIREAVSSNEDAIKIEKTDDGWRLSLRASANVSITFADDTKVILHIAKAEAKEENKEEENKEQENKEEENKEQENKEEENKEQENKEEENKEQENKEEENKEQENKEEENKEQENKEEENKEEENKEQENKEEENKEEENKEQENKEEENKEEENKEEENKEDSFNGYVADITLNCARASKAQGWITVDDSQVTHVDAARMIAAAADADGAVIAASLSEGAAWSDFGAAFLADASVTRLGENAQYAGGQFLLLDSFDAVKFVFNGGKAILNVSFTGYTKPEKPAAPIAPFAHRFYALDDKASIADMLKAKDIDPSYTNAVLSDTNAVALENGVLTTLTYFDEAVLTVTLADGREVIIKLQNPEPARYTYRTVNETVLVSDVLDALKITGKPVYVGGASDGVAKVPGTVKVLFLDETQVLITLELAEKKAYEYTIKEETALLSDVLSALNISGEIASVDGAKEGKEGWTVSAPSTVTVTFMNADEAVITIKGVVKLEVAASQTKETAEDLIRKDQAQELGLTPQEKPVQTTKTGEKGEEIIVSTKTDSVVLDIAPATRGAKSGSGQTYETTVNLEKNPIVLVSKEDAALGEVKAYHIQVFHIVDGEAVEVPVKNVVIKEGMLLGFTIITDGFSPYVVKYTVDFEYVDDQGETHTWSLPGRGSYSIADILGAVGVTGTVESASLARTDDQGGAANVLYLNDAQTALVSEGAFRDTFELTVVVDGKKHTFTVTDDDYPVYDSGTYSDYYDLESHATGDNGSIHLSYNNQSNQNITIDGTHTTQTISIGLEFEMTDQAWLRGIRAKAIAEGTTINIDYDMTEFINEHDALKAINANGADLMGPGGAIMGSFVIENGHVKMNINPAMIEENVSTMTGSIPIKVIIDGSTVTHQGNEDFTFPGASDTLEINWPATEHPAGSKSVDHNYDIIYPAEPDTDYIYYAYTLTVKGGVGTNDLKLTDYLPSGMELDGSMSISRITTTRQQQSNKTNGLWGEWTDTGSSSASSTATATPASNGAEVDVMGAFSPKTPDTASEPVVNGDTRTRTVTESLYTITYTGRILKSAARTQIANNSNQPIQLTNHAMWNVGNNPFDGGSTTVNIAAGNMNPGTKVIEGVNSDTIQVPTVELLEIGDKKYTKLTYIVSINEPIDATSAVLTDVLSGYQQLYNADQAKLLVNDVEKGTVSLTASGANENGKGGTITFDLTNALANLSPAQTFTKNTKYSLKYETLVEYDADFNKAITNTTDWRINSVHVDGEDRTVTVVPKPYQPVNKYDKLTTTHVVGDGPWDIPWELYTRQTQDVKEVTVTDTFSSDQTVKADSFIIWVGTKDYIVPADAPYLHIDQDNCKFTIDFDDALKALVPGASDPAFKANTDYKINYTTTTPRYNDPDTADTEKSTNTSEWKFDGTPMNASDDVELVKDKYSPGSKLVSTMEGTGGGSWTTDGETWVESIKITDGKIDLSYKITLNQIIDGVTKAQLTDHYSDLETVDFSTMKITVNGTVYDDLSNFITIDNTNHTFTIDFAAVIGGPLSKNTDYVLTYDTSIPLTDEIKAALKTKENGNIIGLTVPNEQSWSFDGPNGTSDVPGNPTEYTFKEKPYNGGDKTVAVFDTQSGDAMTQTEWINNNSMQVVLVDRVDNTLKYEISLTEHRNADSVVLHDAYSGGQTLNESSITVSFPHNGSTVTIPITAANGLSLRDGGFDIDLTQVLSSEGYTFTPEVTYVIRYETTAAAGNINGGDGHNNTATWTIDGEEHEGGNTETHLKPADYVPGTKEVTVREQVGSSTANGTDWKDGNFSPSYDDWQRVHSNVVSEPPYHLDYSIKITETRTVDTALLTDLFYGSANQTLDTGSFTVLLPGQSTPIAIPASFITEITRGFTLNFTAFLKSLNLDFEKSKQYEIHFTTTTNTCNNILGGGDGADNLATWTLNSEIVDGGHTETHIKKVPFIDKEYYNVTGLTDESQAVKNGSVAFEDLVKYVITVGGPNDDMRSFYLEDNMMNLQHIDASKGIIVTDANGTELANLMGTVPEGWNWGTLDQTSWNKYNTRIFYIIFPNSYFHPAPLTGPLYITYYANAIDEGDYISVCGRSTTNVTNTVKSNEAEVTVQYPLTPGSATLTKTALPIDPTKLLHDNVTASWQIVVAPSGNGTSLKDVWIADKPIRFSTNSLQDAINGVNTHDMALVPSSVHVTYQNAGDGHAAGDAVPSSMWEASSGKVYVGDGVPQVYAIKFKADIFEPVVVTFDTNGHENNSYSVDQKIYFYNRAVLIDGISYQPICEPDEATNQYVPNGEIQATKEFMADRVNRETGEICWKITVNTTGSLTFQDLYVVEITATYWMEDGIVKTIATYEWDAGKYDTITVKDRNGKTLVEGTDYNISAIAAEGYRKGIKFLHGDIQGPVEIEVPMVVNGRNGSAGFADGKTTMRNIAIVGNGSGNHQDVVAKGEVENYNLTVEKDFYNDTRPTAPDFNQEVTYAVRVNANGSYMPEGIPVWTDVLPAGMEYVQGSLGLQAWGDHGTNGWKEVRNAGSGWTDFSVNGQILTLSFPEGFSFTNTELYMTYRARLTAAEIQRLKDLGVNTVQVYDNVVTVTQSGIEAHDNVTWEYQWDKGLHKEDVTDAHYKDLGFDQAPFVYYKITINPEERKLNGGVELVLTDRIETSMELVLSSVEVNHRDGTPVTEAKISYDGITRVLTVRVPDQTYCEVLFYTSIENPALNEARTFTNTAVLTGETVFTSSETEEHIVAILSGTIEYTVNSGFVIRKVDGNNINQKLSGAEFTLYRAKFPAMDTVDYASDYDAHPELYDLEDYVLEGPDPNFTAVVKTTGADGTVFFENLQMNTLYYWVETKTPGDDYSAGLFAEPQYLILYNKNDDTSYKMAKMLDHLISDANGVIVNSAVQSYVWVATNNKLVNYKVTKLWSDGNNVENLRPSKVWVQLKQNGANYGEPVEIEANNLGNWEYTWFDLPATDGNGDDYTYTAVELTPAEALAAGKITAQEASALTEQMENYTTLYREVTGGMEITNRLRDETTLIIQKDWNDQNNASYLRPGSVQVYLWRVTDNDTSTKVCVGPVSASDNTIEVKSTETAITLTAKDGWQAEFTGLVKVDGEHTYTYYLTEAPVDGYKTSYEITYQDGGAANANYIIHFTNNLDVVRATKRWLDANGSETWTANVTFKLVKETAQHTFVDVTKPQYFTDNNLEWSQTITTTSTNRTAVWNHLDPLGEGESYFAVEWQIEGVEGDIHRDERGAALDFTLNGVTYDVSGGTSSNGVTVIVNAPRVNVDFAKTWTGVADPSAYHIEVQLKRYLKSNGQLDTSFSTDPAAGVFTLYGSANTDSPNEAGKYEELAPTTEDGKTTWHFRWSGLPITGWTQEGGSVEYVYRVEEAHVKDAGGNNVDGLFVQIIGTDYHSVENSYNEQSIPVTKQWDPEPDGDWSVTAALQASERLYAVSGVPLATPGEWSAYSAVSPAKTVVISKTGDTVSGTVNGTAATVTEDPTNQKYTVTVTGLPLYRFDAQTNSLYQIRYSAEETELTGYTPTVTVDDTTGEITITNTQEGYYSLAVTKNWVNANDQPTTGQDIEFQLIRHTAAQQSNNNNSTESAPTVIFARGGWSEENYGISDTVITPTPHVGDIVKLTIKDLSGNALLSNIEVYVRKLHEATNLYWSAGSKTLKPPAGVSEYTFSIELTSEDCSAGYIGIIANVLNHSADGWEISYTVVSSSSSGSSTSATDEVMEPDTVNGGYKVSESNYTFNLSPNETILFRNLPWQNQDGSETYTYSVQETTTGDFTTLYTYSPAGTAYDPAPAQGETTGSSGTATITNKTTTQYGSLTVTKNLYLNGQPDTAHDSEAKTFYVGLFTDAAGTTRADADSVGGENPKSITVGNNASSGTAEFTGLPVGETYYVFETNEQGTAVYAANSVHDGYTVTYGSAQEVTIAPSGNEASVTNNKRLGNISLTKTVSGQGADEQKDFTFTLTILNAADDNTNTDFAGTFGDVTFTAGVVTLTLKHNETMTVTNLPAGTRYKIEESDYSADNYAVNTVTVDGTAASLPYTGTIAGGTTGENSAVAVAVDNAHMVGSFKLTKTLYVNEAETTSENSSFADGTYTFSLYKEDGTAVTSGYTLKDGNGGDVSSLSITITDGTASPALIQVGNLPAGSYIIAEDTPSDGTSLFSRNGGTDNTVTVDGKQGIKVTVTSGDPGTVQTAAFVNNKTVTGKITVTKTVQYNSQTDTDFNGTFRVGISETETDAAIDSAKIQEITVTAGVGTPVEFDGLTVGATYYIYEVDENGVPVTDAYEYIVTGSGTSKTITYADLNPTEIEIINNKAETGSLTVTKHVQVNGTDTNVTESKTFTVGLYEQQEGGTWTAVQHMVNGATISWRETITVAAGSATGSAVFSPLTVGKTYRVYELDGNGNPVSEHYEEYTVSYDGEPAKLIGRGANNAQTANVYNNKETLSRNALKRWANNATPPANTTVKLEIKATVNGADVFSSLNGVTGDKVQTLPNGNSWEASWSNLPKYYQGVEIAYTVEETEYKINGVPQTVAQPDATAAEGYDFSFTNTLPTTDVTVTKTWGGSSDWPDNKLSVEMTLKANGADAENLPDYNGEVQNVTVTLTSTESSKTWHDLPVYDASGNAIEYTVEETGIKYDDNPVALAQYSVTGGDLTNGTAAIDNTPVTIELTVNKEWLQNGTALTGSGILSNGSVTVKVEKSTDKGASWSVAKDASNQNIENVQITSADNWTKTWSGLPKYAADGTEIKYRVTETAAKVNAADALTVDSQNVEVAFTSGAATLSNPLPTVDIPVTKAWVNDTDTSWPSGVTKVTVGLYANGAAVKNPADTSADYKLDITSSTTDYKVTFTDLPVYTDQGVEIAYSVKEDSVTFAGDPDSTTVNVDQDASRVTFGTGENQKIWTVIIAENAGEYTITNSQNATTITINKRWYNAYGGYESGVTEPVTVELHKVKNGSDTVVTVNGSDTITVTPGTATVIAVDDIDATYYVVETPTFTGYVTRYALTAIENSKDEDQQNDADRYVGYVNGSDSTISAGGTLYVMNTATKTTRQIALHKKWIEFRDVDGQVSYHQLDGDNTWAERQNMKLRVQLIYEAYEAADLTNKVAGPSPATPEFDIWVGNSTHPFGTNNTIKVQNLVVTNGPQLNMIFKPSGEAANDFLWIFSEESGDGQENDVRGLLPEYGFVNGILVKYAYHFVEIAVLDGSADWDDPEDVTNEWWKLWENESGYDSNPTGYTRTNIENRKDSKGSVQIEKVWTDGKDNGAEAVLLTLWRIRNGMTEGVEMTDVYEHPADYGLSAGQIYEDSTGNKYLKLSKGTAWEEILTVTNLSLVDVQYNNGGESFHYYVVEAGYLDAQQEMHEITNGGAIQVAYSSTTNDQHGGHKTAIAKLANLQTLTVTNALKPGSLNITKAIETGTEGTDTFTFQVVLTPATGVAIDPNNLTVTVGSIGTITPANPAAGESVTLTLTISGATASNPQTATISGIPAGTTYKVTEIDLPDGWYQAGEVEYTDADKTVAANETVDTVTITNKKALSISVTKVWTIDGQPKTTAQSIEFELHQVLKQNGEVKQDRVYTGVAGNTTGKFTVNYDNSTTPGTWETVTITGLPLKDTATVSDGGEGTTTIDGCDAFYYVVETPASADAGYVLATTYSNEAQAANPSGTASSKAVNTNNSTITIINEETPGVVLPSTGGPGTAAYTVSGLALMLGAIWMLLRRKRQMN